MKSMKRFGLLVILSSIIYISNYAQNRKEIIEFGIISKTTYDVDYENSNGKESIDDKEIYDEKGNLIEYIKYEVTGKIEIHEKYEYNENNNILKEIKYNPNGKIFKTVKYIYKDSLKVEKITYDATDKMIKKEKYIYQLK